MKTLRSSTALIHMVNAVFYFYIIALLVAVFCLHFQSQIDPLNMKFNAALILPSNMSPLKLLVESLLQGETGVLCHEKTCKT